MKAIFFDLDGTLANTVPLNIECFQFVFRELAGREISYAEVKDLFGPNEKGLIRTVIGERWQEGFELYLSEYKKRHAKCSVPFPGILELLEDLKKKGLRLALVSGKGEETTAFSLHYLGLEHFFERRETGSIEGNIKPTLIRKILNDWKLAPEEVAYVGDSPQDMEDATECGLLAIGAGWDPDAGVLKEPNSRIKICRNPQDVIRIFS